MELIFDLGCLVDHAMSKGCEEVQGASVGICSRVLALYFYISSGLN